MAVPYIKNSFVGGELSPQLWGRTDIEKYQSCASTMRNLYVNYRGGANSRAGTAFVGYSKQTGAGIPPRLVPFQFNIQQGLILEFGNEYMRVIEDGAYVTDVSVGITGITQASPAVVSATATGATTVTPVDSAVSQSYAPGEIATMAGGTYSMPAKVQVTNTKLLAVQVNANGTGYAPGDTITLAGGTQSSTAVATVATTEVVGLPTIVSGGTGGTPGTATVTGTTGTGTKFQASVTITGSQSASPNNGAVTASYAPGDTVTLAGGTFTSPAVLTVNSTELLSLTGLAAGTGYAPGNTITLGGGSTTAAPVVTISTTKVSSVPTIAAGGTGGTPGAVTLTGTTGTGTKFQATGTISSGGVLTAITALTVAGSYTVNPTTLTAEPVTGGGLSGAELSLTMGPNTFTFTAGGAFSANPASGTFTQNATSGSGAGATFTGLFGPDVVTFTSSGSYTVFPSNPVAQGATSGSGAGVTFTVSNLATITAVNSLTVAGSYTVNPTTPAAEPVTGGGLTGAVLAVTLGVATVSVTSAGVFTANAPSGAFTQASTSGSGTGATFYFGLFGPNACTVYAAGSYSAFPSNPVAQASTTGTGLGATFDFTSGATAAFSNGDWVYLSGIGGMTQLNGRILVVESASSSGFSLYDVFGNPVNSTSYSAFTSGGTAARLYTLTTPWADVDLPWLKFTQSADVMSFCCWNQDTLTEYPPYDLTRLTNSSWTIAQPAIGAALAAPTSLTVTPIGSDGGSQVYIIWYYVTAVNGATGEESNFVYTVQGNEALGTPNGSGNTPTMALAWPAVPGATYYNIYAESPRAIQSTAPTYPPTYIAGRIGQTSTTSFIDTGFTPDYSLGPPQHNDPFSPGAIVSGNVINGGAGYKFEGATATIGSSTGSGGVVYPVNVLPGAYIGSMYIYNAGSNYTQGDTITINANGSGGSGATATLTIGPKTGTYPGVVGYFQQRRVYAATQNNLDTYWMSQTGLYLNFDTHFPTVANDALSGSPWSLALDGIQWMVNMPGGLVVLTGRQAWQLCGSGGSSQNPQPVTPSTQIAQPQMFNGISATVPPIRIDDQVIFVQSKNSIYRMFQYQYFYNIYNGIDLTEFSSQLFIDYQIVQHAYAEEPYKIVWSVRNDGILLSLTYDKTDQQWSWARHDTNGLYVSVATITEIPVDAVYLAVERTINGQTSYMIERMDDRFWPVVEDVWAVDAGVQMPLTYPAATLNVSSPTGLGSLTGVTNLVGGSGYASDTAVVIVDNNGLGPGTGAAATVSVSAGSITAVNFTAAGSGYIYPQISFIDPTNAGSGASCQAVLNNAATFTASASVFSANSVGNIIRTGGGIAVVTAYTSGTQVTGNILVPITAIYQNSGSPTSYPAVQPQASGNWSMTTPTSTVTGLWHLVGVPVTGLADGAVIPPQTVSALGTITLSVPATLITVGLGFTAQLQTAYFDAGPQGAMQGRRKRVSAITARIELSNGIQVGTNQPDGSALSPPQIAPFWQGLTALPNPRVPPYNYTVPPLFTGDVRIPAPGNYDTRGQVAFQQSNPLPMNVNAVVTEILDGDLEAGSRGGQPAGGGNTIQGDTGFYFALTNYPPSVGFTNPPVSGLVDVPLDVTGVVYPAGQPVQIAFSTSGTLPPSGGWVSVTVSSGTWSGALTPSTYGNFYIWSRQTNNPSVLAVTGPVNIAQAGPPVVLQYTGATGITGSPGTVLTLPNDVAVGNLILLTVMSGNNGVTPSQFFSQGFELVQNVGTAFYVFSKTASSLADGSVTVTRNGTVGPYWAATLREIRNVSGFGGLTTGTLVISGQNISMNAVGSTQSAECLYYAVTGIFNNASAYTNETNWSAITPSGTVLQPNYITNGPPWVLYSEFILPSGNGSQQFTATSAQSIGFDEGCLPLQLIGFT